MPTPIELLTAAQNQLTDADAHLAQARTDIATANNLIEQAKAGIVPPPLSFPLTVVSGSGSGSYPAGAVVPVVANAATPPFQFDDWLGPVADATNPSTTVSMPAAGVQVEATYKSVTPPVPGRVTSLVHLGSFNLPQIGSTDAEGYPYANAVLAFCAARKSLFIGAFAPAARVGEVLIPAFGATAVSMQLPKDPFGGKLGQINPGSPNQKMVGGIYVDGDTLVVSAYDSYDGTGTQRLSHFRRPLDLSTLPASVAGPYQVGPLNAAFYDGYMGRVPPAWQTAFRGRAFTGQAGIAIVSNGSYGCSIAAFDPGSMGQTAIELIGYPDAHQTLGPWNKANPFYGGSDTVKGIVMPDNFSAVLFFGRHGTTFCYGGGSSQQPPPAGECYDPTSSYKGVHGYPYNPSCWGYDAADVAAVAAGTKAPWDIRPYTMFTVPNLKPNAQIGGAAYDPATGRIYVSELNANGTLPVIHVYEAR